MTIPEYLSAVNVFYKSGVSATHAIREALSQLIESLATEITMTGKRESVASYAPDYVLTKEQIPVGYVEVKDPEKGRSEEYKERFERYKTSLGNLLFTDCLDFDLYRDGEFVTRVAIGRVEEGLILPIRENFDAFGNMIRTFTTYTGRSIDSAKELAGILAGKACLLYEVIHTSIGKEQTGPLKDQMEIFRQLLARDTTAGEFAEVYAPAVIFGIFTAYLHNPAPQNFSRQEATSLIPKSNTFSEEFFNYVADPNPRNRIRWVVDDLVNTIRYCNMDEILKKNGKSSDTEKILTSFYEIFLSEYILRQRKSRDEQFSPMAVKEILKTIFRWPESLTCADKTVPGTQGNKIPDSFFILENEAVRKEYQKGLSVTDLFPAQGAGIVSKGNSSFTTFPQKQLMEDPGTTHRSAFHHSVFDIRYINYDVSRLSESRSWFLKNSNSENLLISLVRNSGNNIFIPPFITRNIVDEFILSATEKACVFPLYLYPEPPSQTHSSETEDNFENIRRKPNLNMEIVRKIGRGMGLAFIPEEEIGNVCFASNNAELRDEFKQVFTPLDLLDYLYAVLYSPAYRDKYKKFLEIDFPRIPYPQDSDIFWQLVKPGGMLRRIHLMESSAVRRFITTFPVEGTNRIKKPHFIPDKESVSLEDNYQKNLTGKIYINSEQYFSAVPEIAWDAYIGSYQPARKWLEDRSGQALSPEDIHHYQQIIVALTETHRIMQQIGQLPFC